MHLLHVQFTHEYPAHFIIPFNKSHFYNLIISTCQMLFFNFLKMFFTDRSIFTCLVITGETLDYVPIWILNLLDIYWLWSFSLEIAYIYAGIFVYLW